MSPSPRAEGGVANAKFDSFRAIRDAAQATIGSTN